MPTNELIPALLYRFNENQLAMAAAVEEIALWGDDHGSPIVANNVRGALATLDNNLEHITRGIAELMND
ncbi:hypothetical protein [Pseudomonas akapageensis]|uniref:hypothetical protein n=1 Tax=Pseudomonas akapageensis TaxID=2609961 RepID=UPI00140A3295|nr:hypothetical protein [Pseudomonas akapageensis]